MQKNENDPLCGHESVYSRSPVVAVGRFCFEFFERLFWSFMFLSLGFYGKS